MFLGIPTTPALDTPALPVHGGLGDPWSTLAERGWYTVGRRGRAAFDGCQPVRLVV